MGPYSLEAHSSQNVLYAAQKPMTPCQGTRPIPRNQALERTTYIQPIGKYTPHELQRAEQAR